MIAARTGGTLSAARASSAQKHFSPISAAPRREVRMSAGEQKQKLDM